MILEMSKNVFIQFVILVSISMLAACEKMEDRPINTDVSKEEAANTFNFQANTGWIHGNCLAIKRDLELDEKITVVFFDQKSKLQNVNVENKATTGSGCFALFDDRKEINLSEGRRFYTLNGLDKDSALIAIGLVDAHGRIKLVDSIIDSDLDADTKREIYSTCETSEGINFYVWSEQENKGLPLWSDYYYLGYDLQPTCP